MAETAPATDASTNTRSRARTTADTAPATDTSARSVWLARLLTEAAPAGDLTTAAAAAARYLLETALATDSTDHSVVRHSGSAVPDPTLALDSTGPILTLTHQAPAVLALTTRQGVLGPLSG